MLDNNVQFYSGSTGAMCFGVVFGTSWSYLCWHLEWNMDNNNFLEFVPIVLGFYLWPDKLPDYSLICLYLGHFKKIM